MNKKRKILLSGITASLLFANSLSAGVISSNQNTTQTFSSGDAITINSGVTVEIDANSASAGTGVTATTSVESNINLDADIINNGTLSIVETNTTNRGDFKAIYVDANSSANITNNGTISISSDKTSKINQFYGIDIVNENTGTIENSSDGQISFTGSSGAYGINVRGNNKGTLINNGSFNFDINHTFFGGQAIKLWSDNLGSIIFNGEAHGDVKDIITLGENNGTIRISDIRNDLVSDKLNYLVRVGDDNNNLVDINASSINIDNNRTSSTYIVYVYRTNNGTITSSADYDINSSNAAVTILNANANTGTITNTGNIVADVRSLNAFGTAGNWTLIGDNNGTITNNGSIKANVSSSSNIFNIAATNNGSLTNNGDINVTSTGGDSDRLFYIGSGNEGNITNSATVNIDTNGTAYGYKNDGYHKGNFTNSGIIDLNSSANNAYGIYLSSDNNGTITNSGTITVSSDTNTSYGVYIDGNNSTGTITNSGTITADTAIYISGDGNITNSSSGVLSGNVTASSATLTNDGNITRNVTVSRLTNSSKIDGNATVLGTSAVITSGTIGGNLVANNTNVTNSGTIGGYVTAVDLSNTGTISGDVNASGTTLSNGSSATIGGNIIASSASLTNDGNITGDVTVSRLTNSGKIDGNATVLGTSAVITSGTIGGNLVANNTNVTNSGTIGGYVTAVDLNNTGTINGDVNASGTSVVNSSIITGKLTASSANIVNSGTIAGISAVSLTNSGTILGDIELSGSLTNKNTISTSSITLNNNLRNEGNLTLTSSNQTSSFANLTLTSGSTLGVGLDVADNNATQVHKVVVSGTATIFDGVNINFDVQSDENRSKQLFQNDATVFLSAGTLDVNVSELNVTDTSALMDFTIEQNENNLTVKALAGLAEDAAKVNSAKGAYGAANAIDKIALGKVSNNNADISNYITKLRLLKTTQEVAKAVLETTPVAITATPAVSSKIVQASENIVGARLSAVTGGNSGDAAFSDRNLWFKPFGGKTTQGNENGFNGFDASFGGFGIGVDGEYDDNKRIGVALFYTKSNMDTNDIDDSTKLNSYNVLVYGVQNIIDPNTELSYNVGLGFQSTKTNRTISATSQKATAEYTSKLYTAKVKLARDYKINNSLSLFPGISGAITHFRNPDYSETGAGGLNLDVKSFSTNEYLLGLDTELRYKIDTLTNLKARVGLNYNLDNDAQTVSSSYQGASNLTFDTKGLKSSSVGYEASLGLNRKINDDLSLDVDYNFDGKSSSFETHSLSMDIKYKF